METREYYVYTLRVEDEESPFYVGKGHGNRAMFHMMPSHLRKVSPKTAKIRKALREGKQILIERLWGGLSEDDALRREVWAIHLFGKKAEGGCLTNLTDGGDGTSGLKHSEEVKTAVSLRLKGNTYRRGVKLSEATRAKIKAVKSITSEETRLKMSVASKGRTVPTELAYRRVAKLRGVSQPKVSCLLCRTICSPATLSRWHSKNCKRGDRIEKASVNPEGTCYAAH